MAARSADFLGIHFGGGQAPELRIKNGKKLVRRFVMQSSFRSYSDEVRSPVRMLTN
jgi:hypothetical protein